MYELELFNSLLEELKQVVLLRNKFDGWEWKFDKSKMYSVKSAYSSITFSSLESNFSAYPFQQLWKSKAPLKFISFVWRLFLDRIPTRDVFFRRCVSMINDGGTSCTHCNDQLESSQHSFFSRSFSYRVWQLFISGWISSVTLPHGTINNFMSHLCLVKDRKHRHVWSSIWLATIWAIWRARNEFIFNNGRHSLSNILDAARVNA
ncbi:hypothetical protein Lal_00011005 [Lupinus albus]|nr:hypothetical protein Lal_00011005 [Lupinus albus]